MATADPTPVSLSGDPRIDGLIEPSNWITDRESLVLTWSPHDFGGGKWTPAELVSVQSAFATWSAVANIKFVRVDDPHHFRATAADLAVVATGTRLGEREDAAGLAFTPDPGYTNFSLLGTNYNATTYPDSQGDIFIDDPPDGSFVPGGFGFYVLVHEIGHALGLKHPHDTPFSRTFDALGIGGKDSQHWSVMSYNNPQGEFPSLSAGWAVTPMPYDILAIQYVYGANMEYHAGDDTYMLYDNHDYRTIWDAGGEDTLVIGTGGRWTVNLAEGAFSTAGSRTAIAVAFNVTIENAIGGDGADRLLGNPVANELSGEDGNDRLDGRGGGDLLTGGNGRDILLGGPGRDTLFGNGNVDVIRGGPGADLLDSGPGRDVMRGDSGADVLVFSPFDTLIDGGTGIDTLLVTGPGRVVDPAPDGVQLRGIEIIDLQGTGMDMVVLSLREVLDMSGSPGPFLDDDTVQVMIRGSIGDQFVSVDQGWTRGADVVIDGLGFAVYTAGGASVLLQSGVEAFLDYHPVPEIALADLDGRNGYGIRGDEYERLGNKVAGAGDFNGDGFDDYLVSTAGTGSDGGAGGIYLMFGGVSQPAGMLATGDVDGFNGFRFAGESNGFESRLLYAGFSGAGDVNGDGLADIVIGVSEADVNGQNTGSVYVVYGTRAPQSPDFELDTLDGSNGFRITGKEINDGIGMVVSGAGDVNGDGYGDLLVLAGDNFTFPSACYVLYGSATGFDAEVTLSDLDGSNGFAFVGSDSVRFSTAAAVGDVNGDALADIVVGSYNASSNGTYSGAAFVVFGQADRDGGQVFISDLDGIDGFQVHGAAPGDFLGQYVDGAGDVNGDGLSDIIVGATHADGPTGAETGAAYVLFGSATGFAPVMTAADIDGSNGFTFRGTAAYSFAGSAVSGAGDVNADGYDDVLVGVMSAENEEFMRGGVAVLFGHGGPFGDLHYAALDGGSGLRIPADSASYRVGTAVDGVGDVNGDGFDDILIGADQATLNYTPAGATYVIMGGAFRDEVDIQGTPRGDVLVGGGAGEIIVGGRGSDRLVGKGGDDFLAGARGDDDLRGGAGADQLRGGSGVDELAGGAGDDELRGGDGDDWLRGGAGVDVLWGGLGRDVFVFDQAPDDAHADVLRDFAVPGPAAGDFLALDAGIFASLAGDGVVEPGRFVSGVAPVALDADDFLLYDTDSGALYYDADGSGAGAALLFAVLATAPDALDATDFIVV